MLWVEAEGGASQVVDTQEHGREGQGMTFERDRGTYFADQIKLQSLMIFFSMKDTYKVALDLTVPEGKTELNSLQVCNVERAINAL